MPVLYPGDPVALEIGKAMLGTFEDLLRTLQQRQAATTDELHDMCERARTRLTDAGARDLDVEHAADEVVEMIDAIELQLIG